MICGNDARVLDLLDVAPEQKLNQPGVPPKEWPKIIAGFDIGVAPLDARDGEHSYDFRRSWIKGLEYNLAQVPFIATRSPVYAAFDSYGVMVENTADDWYIALKNIADNLIKAKKQARRDRKFGLSLTLDVNVENIVLAYDKIMTAALPELPNVFYVNWDGRKDPKSVGESHLPPRPTESVLDQIQKASMQAAENWGQIEIGNFNLIPTMQYDLTQRFNRELLESVTSKNE